MITNTRIALITGASSGIGAAFARKLASLGYDLVLVARREARLKQMVADLQSQFPIHAEALAVDLSHSTGIERVEQRISQLTNIQILVNSAGFGDPGTFAENSLEQTLAVIDVHIVATTRLSRAVLPGMIARNSGTIINVSSIGAFTARPSIELVYCASKAYLNMFSEGLQAQLDLQGTNIRIQALCPGFTHTEFHDNPVYEAQQIKTRIPSWLWMSADEVVEASLRGLKRRQVIYIPGILNRFIVVLARSGVTRLFTQRLQSSQHMTIDGDAGTVTISNMVDERTPKG